MPRQLEIIPHVDNHRRSSILALRAGALDAPIRKLEKLKVIGDVKDLKMALLKQWWWTG
jgi:hypothetical protein